MASNPRYAPSNVGVNAINRAKTALQERRGTPGAGVPQVGENNNASARSRNSLMMGKNSRAQGGGGAGPVPAQQKAADRALAAAAERKAARAQQGR